MTDLLDAQQNEQEAQTELVSAYANYEVKEINYLYMSDNLNTKAIPIED